MAAEGWLRQICRRVGRQIWVQHKEELSAVVVSRAISPGEDGKFYEQEGWKQIDFIAQRYCHGGGSSTG